MKKSHKNWAPDVKIEHPMLLVTNGLKEVVITAHLDTELLHMCCRLS